MNTRTSEHRPCRHTQDHRHRPARDRWTRPTPIRVIGAAVTLAISGIIAGAPQASADPDAYARASASAILPAPPQISALDPLRGAWQCNETAPPPGGEPTVLYLNVKKEMDGHYYYVDVVLQPGNLRGRAIWGWDPVNRNFFAQYHDNWGSSSTTTSPGWVNGHLIFTGSLIQVAVPSSTGYAQGAQLQLKDDYTLVDPDNFKALTTVTLPNGAAFQHGYDCRHV